MDTDPTNHPLFVGLARKDEKGLEQPPLAKEGHVPKVCFRFILTGPSKSGKTNMARWALDKFYTQARNKKKSFFDRIILLSPTSNIDPTWADLAGLDEEDRVEEPTPEFLGALFAEQRDTIETRLNAKRSNRAKALKGNLILVIADDAVCESALIRSPEFLKLFIQGRHYGISTMCMTQSYMLVPRSCRIQATHIAMFQSKSTEIDRLWTEHGPHNLSKRKFRNLVEWATTPTPQEQYPFLYIDTTVPTDTRFRRGFHTILRLTSTGRQRKRQKMIPQKKQQPNDDDEEIPDIKMPVLTRS